MTKTPMRWSVTSEPSVRVCVFELPSDFGWSSVLIEEKPKWVSVHIFHQICSNHSVNLLIFFLFSMGSQIFSLKSLLPWSHLGMGVHTELMHVFLGGSRWDMPMMKGAYTSPAPCMFITPSLNQNYTCFAIIKAEQWMNFSLKAFFSCIKEQYRNKAT